MRPIVLVLLGACGPGGPPVADAPAVVTLQEDTPDPVEISVVVDDEEQLEKYEIEITEAPEHGDVDPSEGAAPLRVTYQPSPDFFGTDHLGYTIRRGKEETEGVVVLVVEPEPDQPQAVDDDVATTERAPLAIDVVANDVDPDEDLLLVTGVEDATSGTVEIVGAGTILYTPVVGVLGEQTFEYTIEDPTGRSDQAVVTVTVTAAAAVAIDTFTATPAHPDLGDPVELAWTTSGATSCALDPGEIGVATDSSLVVHPDEATTYLLTCQGPGGPVVAAVSVLPWGEDVDGDGVNDLRELDLGLDPIDPDTDADGVFDGIETGTDPLDPDSDDDGWADGEEDLDRDGAVGPAELDPVDPDSDGDGVCDGPRVDDDGDGIGPADGCVDPDVWFVKPAGAGDGTTWAQAFGALQAAFTAASDGDHVWVAQGTYAVAPVTVTKDLHVVGGFAGDEATLAARDGQATVLNEPAPGGGTTRMFAATGVDVTFAGLSTDAYDAGWLLADGSTVRAWGLDFEDAPAAGAVAFLVSSSDVVIARSSFDGLASGSSVFSDGSDVVIADTRFVDGGGANFEGGAFTAARSRWSGDGQLSLLDLVAVLAEVQFTNQSLLIDEATDATIVDATFDGPGDGLIVQNDSVAYATGVSLRGKTTGVVGCDDAVHLANAVFHGSATADTACTGTLTVTGSASDEALPSGNTLLTDDPFVVFASGEVLLDPEGQAVDEGSDASGDDATRGYPAVGLDWRVRSATSDRLPDGAPVDAGAHADRAAARIRTLSASAAQVAWDVVGARSCSLAGPGIDLVLDAPTTGHLVVTLAGEDEVTMRCHGPIGTLPALARAVVP